MSVGSRIKEARLRAGITQEQLAAALNVSKGAIGNYESDTNYPKTEIIFDLCRILKCDPNYIYQDDVKITSMFQASVPEQRMLRKYRSIDEYGQRAVQALLDVEYERCTKAEQSDDAPESPALVDYRRYTSPAAAGAPLWAESEYETISCNPDDVPAGADYAVGIQGASMEPDVPDGATVWVHRSEQPGDGDIVIAWVEGEGTVCKQAVCDGDQIIRLHSINPAYPDIEGEDLEGLRVYGVVVGMME